MTPDTDASIRYAARDVSAATISIREAAGAISDMARAVKTLVEKPHHDGVGYTTIGSALVQALGRIGR